MNNIVKNVLFLGAGLFFLSGNLDAAARGQTTPKKKTAARVERKRVENKVVENKADDKKVACSICLQPMDPSDNDTEGGVQATTCMHTFHKNCLVQALQANPRCPECRTNLNPADYSVRAGQQAPRRRAAAARGNPIHIGNQPGQNPGPLRWCLYTVFCCLRCPRAPRNLVR